MKKLWNKMEFDVRMMIILLIYKFVEVSSLNDSTESYDSREDIRISAQRPQPPFYDRPNNNKNDQNHDRYPNNQVEFLHNLSNQFLNNPRCSLRLESALEQIRRRQLFKEKTLNLKGYSLHKQLRSIPYDMYVTDMRVRLPTTTSWVRVERCQYNPLNTSLETKLLFNDLTISGSVNLYRENELQRSPYHPEPADTCNMILRLRKAGIGFYTEPIRRERGQFNVRTDSHFLEPGFISVYAYGCEPKMKQHRRSGVVDEENDLDISREMEDIFLKGIRTLLTTYMQKELQPAIKETLMRNMGYTISYGR